MHKGRQTVGQVQERVLSSSGTIPVIINNLVKRQLIVKFMDPHDRRRTFLEATEAGVSLIEHVFPENVTSIANDLSVYTEEEKEQLLRLLLKSNL